MHADTAGGNWPETPEHGCSPGRNAAPRHGIAASDAPLDNSETIVLLINASAATINFQWFLNPVKPVWEIYKVYIQRIKP